MPIIYERQSEAIKQSEGTKMKPEEFANEAELQQIVAQYPDLLMADDEPSVELVTRELELPGAGVVDVVLVDSQGLPIVVEVKLARNTEVRRQVMAQVFDYVSALTLMTVDELNNAVDGALRAAMGSFAGNSDAEKHLDKLWQACGANLRSGQARVVVAVDGAPEDLIRIIRFINDHSDLDVRLVAIRKYAHADEGTIFVPSLLVHGRKRPPPPPPEKLAPEFEAVLAAYARIAPKGLEARGGGATVRTIRPEAWPESIHYEFLDRRDDIGVEIHLEGDDVKEVAQVLRVYEEPMQRAIPSARVEWDPRWWKNRGRLKILYPRSPSPEIIASGMKQLIEQTHKDIDRALSQSSTAK